MELSLQTFFRHFNAPKFVTYSCTLCFCILFSLRLDEIVDLSYVIIFLPLWICEAIVFLGSFAAVVSFLRHPPTTAEVALRTDFYGMLLCAGEHALVLIFEILSCYKLETDVSSDELPWLLVFSPLFVLSIISVIVTVWAIRSHKSFELEFFFATNIVQFFFIAFKLDDVLDWHWTIVFIPLWIILSLSIVGVLYAFVLAIILARSVHIMASQRRRHLYSAICHTFLVIPLLIFLILLTGKLDGISWTREEKLDFPYILVATPLIFSLFALAFMSFGARGGNPWWFAMRTPFCTFLLDSCPCLRQYSNLSYKFSTTPEEVLPLGCDDHLGFDKSLFVSTRPVVPIHAIELPD